MEIIFSGCTILYCIIKVLKKSNCMYNNTCLTPPNCTKGLGNRNGGFSMYSLTLTEKFLKPLGGVGTTLKNDWKAFSKIGSCLFDNMPVKYFPGFSASYCSTSTPTTKYSPSWRKKKKKMSTMYISHNIHVIL